MRVVLCLIVTTGLMFVRAGAQGQPASEKPNASEAAVKDALARAAREPHKDRRAEMLRELLREHPGNVKANELLFGASEDIVEQERIYAFLKSLRPDDAFLPFNMAAAYAHANVKLDKAMALLDETDKLLAQPAASGQPRYSEGNLSQVRKFMATMRADILIRQGKPEEAVATLQKFKSGFRAAHSYYLLGEALEAAGKKREAVDAYLEAVVRPSPDDAKHTAALERLWLSEKLGTKEDLQKKIEDKLANDFQEANYVPKLMARQAPEFEFVTLKGERLKSSALNGKKVILNFWSPWCGPCLPELAPLQEFQESHLQVVVLAVVMPPAEDRDLEKVIRERNLGTLRIAKGTAELWEKFSMAGVPNTVIIDEGGYVRVRHEGSIPDVNRYLEADLKAIATAGPAKETLQPAAAAGTQ